MRHLDERVEERIFHVQELGAKEEIIATATRAHLPSPPLSIQTLGLKSGSRGLHEPKAVRDPPPGTDEPEASWWEAALPEPG